MKLPSTYLRLIGRGDDLGAQTTAAIDPDGAWHGPVDSIVYPPVGYFSWPFCELGNGDYYGYYWPVGKENSEPLVAMMSHDCGALIPLASSIEKLAQLEPDHAELADFSEPGRIPVAPNDLPLRLSIDGRSPFLLVANGDHAVEIGDLARAEELYKRALAFLPEYTAAHTGLATIYRRLRREEDAASAMLSAIRSPLCFWGASFWSETCLFNKAVNRDDYRRKCLYWLRQLAPKVHDPSIQADPLFQAREKLSFATGVTENEDFRILDEAIDAYLACGNGIHACHLAMTYGELMLGEATPFRERSGFSVGSQRDRLMRVYGAAGLVERVELLARTDVSRIHG